MPSTNTSNLNLEKPADGEQSGEWGDTVNSNMELIDAAVATKTGSETLTNKTLTSPVLNTGASGTAIKDEDNMASDSATHLATQQSIKAYVDSQSASEEEVEDIVGAMTTSNTETGIAVTYQDADGTLDFVVSDTTVSGDTGSTGITPGDTLTIAGGTNVSTAMSGDTLTITATATDTTVAGDSGSTGITPGDTLTIAGGANITTAMSGDTLTITGSASGALADLDIDGGTDIGEALVDADLFIVDNGAGGTNRKSALSRLKTYVTSDNTLTLYKFTATAAQTTFTGNDDSATSLAYTAGALFVTLNGSVLENGTDYTATNGTSIVLTDAATLSHELNVYAFGTFNVATVTGASGDFSVADDQSFTSDAAVVNFGVNSDVTLTHVHDTGLSLSAGANLSQLEVISTEAGSGVGPYLKLNRDSASPDNNDHLGGVTFYGDNNAGESTQYARIYGRTLDVADGSEDASITFQVRRAGSLATAILIDDDKVQLNATTIDVNGAVDMASTLTLSGAADLTIANGNLVVAAGHGIDFSANTHYSGAGGMESELFHEYEEGNFTATLTGTGATGSVVTRGGNYTKIGRDVHLDLYFVNSNTTGFSGSIQVTGLPFAANTVNVGSCGLYNIALVSIGAFSYIGAGESTLEVYCNRDASTWLAAAHSAGTGRYMALDITYRV